ncbi:MAG: hypothetical protein ACLTSX_03110 [Collinsella sp.]
MAVELLAPAGTPDALRAAIAAGADAVYVGLGSFNARAANGGFSLAELSSACVLAHARRARVYVTLSVYACGIDELGDAVGAGGAVREAAGADALIVADMEPSLPVYDPRYPMPSCILPDPGGRAVRRRRWTLPRASSGSSA